MWDIPLEIVDMDGTTIQSGGVPVGLVIDSIRSEDGAVTVWDDGTWAPIHRREWLAGDIPTRRVWVTCTIPEELAADLLEWSTSGEYVATGDVGKLADGLRSGRITPLFPPTTTTLDTLHELLAGIARGVGPHAIRWESADLYWHATVRDQSGDGLVDVDLRDLPLSRLVRLRAEARTAHDQDLVERINRLTARRAMSDQEV